jgi:hypothetical protein
MAVVVDVDQLPGAVVTSRPLGMCAVLPRVVPRAYRAQLCAVRIGVPHRDPLKPSRSPRRAPRMSRIGAGRPRTNCRHRRSRPRQRVPLRRRLR